MVNLWSICSGWHYNFATSIGNTKPNIYATCCAIISGVFLITEFTNMTKEPIYRITFFNQGQVYEIYARHVFQSDLWGFLEVEQFVFGERSKMIVDPAEEKLKSEFSSIKRSFIPLQSVVRIDEVEKEGTCKISEAPQGGNVSSFPFPNMAGAKPTKE